MLRRPLGDGRYYGTPHVVFLMPTPDTDNYTVQNMSPSFSREEVVISSFRLKTVG